MRRKSFATSIGASALAIVGMILVSSAWLTVAAQEIEVNSADPSVAAQGTVNLNVTIKGKGFRRGAVARFLVTGTAANTGGITVNATTFVGPNEVIANIDVSDTAELAKFDIEVQNADGRTGKGIELFDVVATGALQSQDPETRADFRDFANDRLRSDGTLLPPACGPYDYADTKDPCQPGHRTISSIYTSGLYFLRTLATQDPNPTRWLVLDFGSALGGSSCPGLDTRIKSYSGRSPDAFSPEDPDPCIDLVEVRFFADKAFAPGAAFTPASVIIDGPDLVRSKSGTRTQWNTKYNVEFVNPLRIVPDPLDPLTITLETMEGLEQAELWTVSSKTGKNEIRLGTYQMPFQLRVTRVP